MDSLVVCEKTTLAALKKHALYTSITGRSKLNKADLCKAINKKLKTAKKPKKVSPKAKSPEKKSASLFIPKEIRELLLLNMNPDTLKNACLTDKQATKICTDDNFWKSYYESRNLPFERWHYKVAKRIKDANTLLRASIYNEIRKKYLKSGGFRITANIKPENMLKLKNIIKKQYSSPIVNRAMNKMSQNPLITFDMTSDYVEHNLLYTGGDAVQIDYFFEIFELLSEVKVLNNKNKTIKSYPDN